MSHAWIEVDGMVVDLTADQFEDAPKMLVMRQPSAWHESWTGIERESAVEALEVDADLHEMERRLLTAIIQHLDPPALPSLTDI